MTLVSEEVKAQEVASVASDIEDAAMVQECSEVDEALELSTPRQMYEASKAIRSHLQEVIQLYDGLIPISVEEHARIKQHLQALVVRGDELCEDVAMYMRDWCRDAECEKWLYVELALHGRDVSFAARDSWDLAEKFRFVDLASVEKERGAIGICETIANNRLPDKEWVCRPEEAFWELDSK